MHTSEFLKGNIRIEPGKRRLSETRKAIESGWRSVAGLLANDDRHDLANDVRQFVERMSAVKTEREWIAYELLEGTRDHRAKTTAIALVTGQR